MSDKENKDLQNTVEKLMSIVDEQNEKGKRFGFVACLVDSNTATFSVVQNCNKDMAMSILKVTTEHIIKHGDGPKVDPKDLN